LNFCRLFRSAAIVYSCSLIVAACANGSQSVFSTPSSSYAAGFIVRPPKSAGGTIYAAPLVGYHLDTVFEYSQRSGKQTGQITGFDGASGLAVDSNGNLYVANCLASDALVFAPGASQPSLILTGTAGAQTIAVSPAGEVAVVAFDFDHDITYASFYHKGERKPFKRIGASYFLQNDTSPFAAYDDHGNLYIVGGSDNHAAIGEIIGGGRGSAIKVLAITNLFVPEGIAVDRDHHLLVADQPDGSSGVVYQYQLPDPSSPIATMSLAFDDPSGIALTKSGKSLYVAFRSGEVASFAYPAGGSPTQTVELPGAAWIALSPAEIP
jgi:DNA-binding beta-propeller fold protein YncE